MIVNRCRAPESFSLRKTRLEPSGSSTLAPLARRGIVTTSIPRSRHRAAVGASPLVVARTLGATVRSGLPTRPAFAAMAEHHSRQGPLDAGPRLGKLQRKLDDGNRNLVLGSGLIAG